MILKVTENYIIKITYILYIYYICCIYLYTYTLYILISLYYPKSFKSVRGYGVIQIKTEVKLWNYIEMSNFIGQLTRIIKVAL